MIALPAPPQSGNNVPDQPLIILSYKSRLSSGFAFTYDINIINSIPSLKNASATQIESILATGRGLF